MQTEDTYIRTVLKPQNKQAEPPQQYHATWNLSQHQLPSLKGFPHKTGTGNDEPQAKSLAELPSIKGALTVLYLYLFSLAQKG